MAKLLEKDLIGKIGTQKYLCSITWRNGKFNMDEPNSNNGRDLGPDPYTALLSSLTTCTLATLRMYIDRKGWDIPEITIAMNATQELDDEFETVISRQITFSSDVSTDQKERLLLIADKCPISRILKGKVSIRTKM